MTLFESKQHLQRLFKITRSLNAELLEAIPAYADQHRAWGEPCFQEVNFRQAYMMLQTLSEILNDSHYEVIMLAPSKSHVEEMSKMLVRQVRMLKKVRDAMPLEVAD